MITKRIGAVLIIAGLILMGIATLGHFTALGDYQNSQAREGEAFDSELAAGLGTWSSLSNEAERRVANSGGDKRVMMALYELVAERFTHGDAAHHNLFSNWLLAGIGAVHPAFAQIRVPETMARRGHSLLCGQSSYVLLTLAQEHGIRVRHVGLFGHVVMEAWYDDDWHLFDPDLEVVPRDSNGGVLSVQKLAQSPDLLDQYYGEHDGDNASMVEILGTRKNNTYMSYPPGAWFEWKSNVLFWFEKLAEILKFILPVFIMGIGAWLARAGGPSSVMGNRA